MRTRDIKRIVKGHETTDGAGVRLVRLLGQNDVKDIDPFLMLDAFDSTNPADYVKGFPLHPHRGIETFTYLSNGAMDHKDTLGNSGRILGGQAQWMNSGSGILHEEMPVASDRLLGLQLWINLPRAHKMTAPTYRDIRSEDMPEVISNGTTVRVVAGKYGEIAGATGQFVQPLILDVSLQSGSDFSLSLPTNDTLFIYVLEGEGDFGETVSAHSVAIFGNGDVFHGSAGEGGIRFMLFSGTPLEDPIAWAGPMVMNTQEELQRAFRELDNGTFIK